MFETFSNDLRHAVRALLNRPSFALSALVTLVIGIGTNIAIFTVLNGALYQPLPFPESERLVDVRNVYPQMGLQDAGTSIPDYLDRRAAPSLESLAIYTKANLALNEAAGPERISGIRASPSLFETLKVKPILGRTFSDDEASLGREQVVVLSHAVWVSQFASNAEILGKTISLDGKAHTVIGVMGPEFFFPTRATQVFLPFAFTEEQVQDTARGNEFSRSIGRLKPGASIEQLDAQLKAIILGNAERIGGSSEPGAGDFAEFLRSGQFLGRALPLRDVWLGQISQTLWALQAATFLLLLIACANVGNLMLTRVLARRRELSLRRALGASRWRLSRHLLIESYLLALLGAGIGLLLAPLLTPLLANALGFDLARGSFAFALDGRVVGFALMLSLGATLVFGLMPLIGDFAGRFDALKEGGRNASEGRYAGRLRAAMVAAQTALAIVLLISGGLLLRSFMKLSAIDPGFDSKGVVTATLQLPNARYPDAAAQTSFYQRLLQAVRSEPGLNQSGVITGLPFSDQAWTSSFRIEGLTTTAQGESGPHGHFRITDENYFDTLKVPVLRGRGFTESDTQSSEQVVVIDQVLADKYFKDTDPLGKRITQDGTQTENPTWWTIVGVVGAIKHSDLSKDETKETYYRSIRQQPSELASLVVRSELSPEQVSAALRRVTQSVDAEMPLYDIRSLDQRIDLTLGSRRASTELLAMFSLLALALAAIGLYGMLSFALNARRGELGVRLAIGASRKELVGLLLKQGLRLGALGIGIGLLAALLGGRLLQSQLFGISFFDVPVYLMVLCVISLVLIIACWLPARRAGGLSPVEALRHE